jgi:serine/threonine-protein kinase
VLNIARFALVFDSSQRDAMRDSGLAIVGKYRILDLVGEGAMGVVYRGVDTVLNRTVALKVMSDAVARQQDLRDRFLREAQAAGSLQHPNVVTIYDFGEVDGHLYIAMEYVDGIDLERLLAAHEPLTIHQRLDIAIDVLNGLSYAHRHGIVHRDVKPANIRVTEEGRAKVMDFGVAYLDSSSLTRTGMMMGTPSYMAPEQVVGGKITAATDIFAVGSVLYELLTGARPFEGNTLHNTLYKIVSEEPPPIREMMPGLPTSLERIVRKALTKEPESRYQNALEMADDLAAVRAELDSEKQTTSTLSLRRSMETAMAARTRTRTRNRTVAAAIGLVVVGAVAASGLWLGTRDEAPPSEPTVALAEPESAGGDAIAAAADTVAGGSVGDTASARPDGGAPDSVRTPPPVIPERRPPPAPVRTDTRSAARNDPPPVNRPADTVPAPSTRQVQARLDTAIPETTRTVLQRDTQGANASAATPRPPVRPAPDPEPVIADSTLIARVVQSYAQAIESRDVEEVRRVYPGLSAPQRQGFQQFFQATSELDVTFSIVRLAITGATAEAAVRGTYDYVQARGGDRQEPVEFTATLRKDNGVWRFVSVR